MVIGAVVLVAFVFVGREGFSFGYVAESFPIFLEATQVTLYVTSLSFAGGMVIGFLVGWARTARATTIRKLLSDRRRIAAKPGTEWAHRLSLVSLVASSGVKYSLRRVADGYVELMRGTPVAVQIMFVWSILLVDYPRLTQLALIAGILALTINTGGYQGEIFRAGLQTVHSGQVEAARALGLSRWGTMRTVVLPQALRLIIPPLTNEYIGLLKVSSLLTVIGVNELTTVGRREAFASFQIFEVFAILVAIYFLITVPLSKAVGYVERRYRIPGLGVQTVTAERV